MKAPSIPPLCLAFLALSCGGELKRFSYEGISRDSWQKPAEVIAALDLHAGDRVADLGSGSGYFTVPLAQAVGPGGRVYAVDIDDEMNDYLRRRLEREGLANVEVVRGEIGDPLLPDGGVDLLFSANTYHHIQHRSEYFRRVRADLAPGGRVAVVDYDGRKGLFVKWIGHYTPKAELLAEMEEAGYRLEADHGFLDRQSFLVFQAIEEP